MKQQIRNNSGQYTKVHRVRNLTMVVLAIGILYALGHYKTQIENRIHGVHQTDEMQAVAATPSERQKAMETIKESQAFQAKVQNLAEQQAIQDEINGKNADIAKLNDQINVINGDIKTLQAELETKRNAGLSL